MQPRHHDDWEVKTSPDLVACTPEALSRIARGEDPELVEAALRALAREELAR
jgi:hypothetical protein